ncbi:MAG: hypothetical protein GF372_13400 [Candidatus Marinimicrobia bacterium]|nr:hypothetical protein [Candidatus Neomarinimicrobiota bacterium]
MMPDFTNARDNGFQSIISRFYQSEVSGFGTPLSDIGHANTNILPIQLIEFNREVEH